MDYFFMYNSPVKIRRADYDRWPSLTVFSVFCKKIKFNHCVAMIKFKLCYYDLTLKKAA